MASLDNLSGCTFYSYLNRLVFSVRTCGYSKTCWVCIKKDSSNSFVTQHCNVFQIKWRISIIPLSQKVCWFERVFPSAIPLKGMLVQLHMSSPFWLQKVHCVQWYFLRVDVDIYWNLTMCTFIILRLDYKITCTKLIWWLNNVCWVFVRGMNSRLYFNTGLRIVNSNLN